MYRYVTYLLLLWDTHTVYLYFKWLFLMFLCFYTDSLEPASTSRKVPASRRATTHPSRINSRENPRGCQSFPLSGEHKVHLHNTNRDGNNGKVLRKRVAGPAASKRRFHRVQQVKHRQEPERGWKCTDREKGLLWRLGQKIISLKVHHTYNELMFEEFIPNIW